MLVLPAVPNYLWESGDSIHGPGYEGAAKEWDAAYEEGLGAWKDDRPLEAAEAFRRAAEIDDEHARLIHNFGLAELELGRPAAGIGMLQRAVDLDRRGDRANSDVREAIRAAVSDAKQAHPAAIFEYRDVAPTLLGFIPRDFDRYRDDRDETIHIDHCHFSAEGHEIMARLVVGFLGELLRTD